MFNNKQRVTKLYELVGDFDGRSQLSTIISMPFNNPKSQSL